MTFTDIFKALQAMADALDTASAIHTGNEMAMLAAAALFDAGYEIVPIDTRNQRPPVPPTTKEQP